MTVYKGCSALTSALQSNPSHLRELNLSENNVKNTGVNHLCDVLNDSTLYTGKTEVRSIIN